MIKLNAYSKLYELGLALLAFVMIALPVGVAVTCVLFSVVIIIGIVKRELKFKLEVLNGLFVLLYLGYIIGSFYTNHPDLANKYLEYKLALLVFPLFFSFVPTKKISWSLPFIAMTAAVVLLSLMGIIHSVQVYSTTGSIHAFIGVNFSYIHHPTYFAVYAIISMIGIVHGLKNNWTGFSWKWCVPLIVFLVGVQILSASLTGELFLLLYVFVIGLRFVYKRYGKIYFLGVFLLSPLIFALCIKIVPGMNDQFSTSKQYVLEYLDNPQAFILNKQTYVGGNETRLIMWTAAALEIGDHPLGVGTGNIDDHLSERLVSLGQSMMAERNFNPHNQFLQTGLEIGLLGLAVLLLLLVLVFVRAVRSGDLILTVLTASLVFNCLFESMLQRQSGIVFYTFWICFLIMLDRIKKETAPIDQ